MEHKGIDIHNIECIVPGEYGGIRWCRVPERVYRAMEAPLGKEVCQDHTGVELRFVMNSDTVILRMRTVGTTDGLFHVYRGSIQGGWEDFEVGKLLSGEFCDFVIKRSNNMDVLQRITADYDMPFAPDVVRVIFDRGQIELLDIIGNVQPPHKEQLPTKTLLTYGSSITHGSNALDQSHSWPSIVAHNLKMDCLNLGMGGSCLMEPDMVDYIAALGEADKWNVATLEMGINVLGWDEPKICQRVENAIRQVAGRNPKKKVYVISPFYSYDDYKKIGDANKWRRCMEAVVDRLAFSNVTYINGLTLLENMSLISADEVHPNIYGVQQIAHRLFAILNEEENN